ncbi:MAG: hypothetical protein ACLPPF_17235 [Rhodomicrobium sp.]
MFKKFLIAVAMVGFVTPSVAEQINVAPGQPLCIDQDSLLAILMVAVLKGPEAAASIKGCEVIAPGSKAELIERYPSGSPLGRVIKVKVTSPKNPGAITGYTIELNK